MLHKGPIAWVMKYAERLRFPQLAALASVVFVVNLFVPDAIPMVDELLMGLIALLLASWRKKRAPAAAETDSESKP